LKEVIGFLKISTCFHTKLAAEKLPADRVFASSNKQGGVSEIAMKNSNYSKQRGNNLKRKKKEIKTAQGMNL
jgi:hypothetical protein